MSQDYIKELRARNATPHHKPHGDEGGGAVHNKGRVHHKGRAHGRGPRQGSGVTKAEKGPPSNQDGGLALRRWNGSHGDVALGA